MTKFDLSSRSSKVIDLGVNRKRICDFLLVINSNCMWPYTATVLEILTLKARKWLTFPTPSNCLTPPLGGNPLEFLDKTYPAKTRRMGLPYSEKFHDLNFDRFYIHTVSQKNKQNYFCYNYAKLPPNLTIFGTRMANCLKLYEVHSFFTSSNSRQCTTVLNADVQNCYITL